MDQQLEDAIPMLRGALRAAAWEDPENVETLVQDARRDEWLTTEPGAARYGSAAGVRSIQVMLTHSPNAGAGQEGCGAASPELTHAA